LIIVYHGINDVHTRLVWPPEHYKGDNSGRRAPMEPFFMPGVLEYSTLWRVVGIRLGITRSHSDFTRTIDSPPSNYYGDLFRDQRYSLRYPEGIFEQVSASEMLQTNPPVYFQRNIENLIAIAKSNGVQILLASFASHPDFKDHPRASSEEYIEAYRETNEVLRRLAEHTQVSFFDFASVFPRERRYYADGRHVTEEGARVKAALFANHLVDTGLLPNQDR
jgi:lysophospholipase L1-like esterase